MLPNKNAKKNHIPHCRVPKWPQSKDQMKCIQNPTATSPKTTPVAEAIFEIHVRKTLSPLLFL